MITEPALRLEAPRELFRGNYWPTSYNFMPVNMNSWDIDPKGNRFLMIRPGRAVGAESPAEPPRRIKIITNWFEELKEKVPVP